MEVGKGNFGGSIGRAVGILDLNGDGCSPLGAARGIHVALTVKDHGVGAAGSKLQREGDHEGIILATVKEQRIGVACVLHVNEEFAFIAGGVEVDICLLGIGDVGRELSLKDTVDRSGDHVDHVGSDVDGNGARIAVDGDHALLGKGIKDIHDPIKVGGDVAGVELCTCSFLRSIFLHEIVSQGLGKSVLQNRLCARLSNGGLLVTFAGVNDVQAGVAVFILKGNALPVVKAEPLLDLGNSLVLIGHFKGVNLVTVIQTERRAAHAEQSEVLLVSDGKEVGRNAGSTLALILGDLQTGFCGAVKLVLNDLKRVDIRYELKGEGIVKHGLGAFHVLDVNVAAHVQVGRAEVTAAVLRSFFRRRGDHVDLFIGKECKVIEIERKADRRDLDLHTVRTFIRGKVEHGILGDVHRKFKVNEFGGITVVIDLTGDGDVATQAVHRVEVKADITKEIGKFGSIDAEVRDHVGDVRHHFAKIDIHEELAAVRAFIAVRNHIEDTLNKITHANAEQTKEITKAFNGVLVILAFVTFVNFLKDALAGLILGFGKDLFHKAEDIGVIDPLIAVRANVIFHGGVLDIDLALRNGGSAFIEQTAEFFLILIHKNKTHLGVCRRSGIDIRFHTETVIKAHHVQADDGIHAELAGDALRGHFVHGISHSFDEGVQVGRSRIFGIDPGIIRRVASLTCPVCILGSLCRNDKGLFHSAVAPIEIDRVLAGLLVEGNGVRRLDQVLIPINERKRLFCCSLERVL